MLVGASSTNSTETCSFNCYTHIRIPKQLCYWLITPFSSYTHTTGMIHPKDSTCHEILFSASSCFFFYSESCKFITPLSAFSIHLVLTELCMLSPTLKCLTAILLISQSCLYADSLTDLISRVNFSSVFFTPYQSFVIVYCLADLTNIV